MESIKCLGGTNEGAGISLGLSEARFRGQSPSPLSDEGWYPTNLGCLVGIVLLESATKGVPQACIIGIFWIEGFG